MTEPAIFLIRLATLPRHEPVPIRIILPEEELAALASHLDLIRAKKVSFDAVLTAVDERDWRLRGSLGATVVQSCVITQAPVTTRIETQVERLFTAEMPDELEDETEIPEDDRMEPLPRVLDLKELITEALALAIPLYPKAPGAELGVAVFSAPGVTPMTEEAAKPLAGLAALKDTLSGPGSRTDDDESKD
jgi:uncharacterized metal-binding protein YceD (DUF177 family)